MNAERYKQRDWDDYDQPNWEYKKKYRDNTMKLLSLETGACTHSLRTSAVAHLDFTFGFVARRESTLMDASLDGCNPMCA